MILHKCGAENAIGAKFCKGCGETLAAASDKQADQNLCPDCGAPNKPGAKFCGKCGTSLSSTPAPQAAAAAPVAVQTPIQNDAPSPPAPRPAASNDIFPERPASSPSIGALPVARQVNSRGPIWLLVGVLALAIAAGAGWWFTAGNKAETESAGESIPTQSAPKSTADEESANASASASESEKESESGSESASMTMPATPADAQPPSGTEKVDRPDDRNIQQEQADRERQARIDSERAKRKAELNAQRRAEQEMQQREMEARRRDMERNQMEEARRRAQQAEVRTVQEICAGKNNIFSRTRCEAKECSRPEQANTRYCVEFRREQSQGPIPGM